LFLFELDGSVFNRNQLELNEARGAKEDALPHGRKGIAAMRDFA
jgi:hypothetical protein